MGQIIINSEKRLPLTQKFIKSAITIALEKLNLKLQSLEINFISAAEIHEINKKYLSHDYSTDIITFDYSDEGSNLIEGELFISLDDARANSEEYKVSFASELLRLVFHGILHLNGMDDDTPEKRSEMQKEEDHLLSLTMG